MVSDLKKAYTAALVQSAIIGLSFLFVKVSLQYAHPLDTLGHRFFVSFVAGTCVLWWGKRSLAAMTWRDTLALVPLALFYPVLFFGFQVFGLVSVSSSQAGIIQATIPVLTILLAAIFIGERTGWWRTLAAFLSVSGVILIFVFQGNGADGGSLWGSFLILLSGVSLAAYNVMARRISRRYDTFTMTYAMLAGGFLVFNVAAVARHVYAGTFADYWLPFGQAPFVVSLLYLGVLSSLLTAYLSNYALSKITASQMSVFANFATLITVLAGVLVLGESLYWYHIVGAIAILTGVIVCNLPSGRHARH